MKHRLYTTTIGDAAATFICPDDCDILAVKWEQTWAAAGDGALIRAELSFTSTNAHTNADTGQHIVDEAPTVSVEAGAAGSYKSSEEAFHYLPSPVHVEAGEKIYLHTANSSGTGSWRVTIYTNAREKSRPTRRN